MQLALSVLTEATKIKKKNRPISQMAEDSELKCKAGRRPQKRNMQLWLQVCSEEGSSRSCLEQRLYQTTRNQWAQRSGLIELDLLNSACRKGREVTGIGRKMMKTKENKQTEIPSCHALVLL